MEEINFESDFFHSLSSSDEKKFLSQFFICKYVGGDPSATTNSVFYGIEKYA